MTRIAFCVNAISSALSASVRSSSSDTRRYGHHHQVARVVRVQVEHRVDQFPARHHQAVLVGHRGDVGERSATPPNRRALHRRLGDVVHPVRRPQPLQMVGFTDPVVDDRAVVRVVRSRRRAHLEQFGCREWRFRGWRSSPRWPRPPRRAARR